MKFRVLILGYGEMGHAMEYLLAVRHDIRIWSLSSPLILEDEVRKAEIILFCLPVNAHPEIVQRLLPCLQANSLCLSIAKGLDESGMTASQIFAHTLAEQQHYAVLYGPMISEEIRLGRHSFADVALSDTEDFPKIRSLFSGSTLICKQVADMTGSSWSVILKNVYAIMFGISDELKMGDNMRGHLLVTALSELSAIAISFGAAPDTPYSYSGLGDLLTTATSDNSHHHELGRKLAAGQFADISGEGVHTLRMVDKFHLFDYSGYPLYTLVHDIVMSPENLEPCLNAYLSRIQTW